MSRIADPTGRRRGSVAGPGASPRVRCNAPAHLSRAPRTVVGGAGIVGIERCVGSTGVGWMTDIEREMRCALEGIRSGACADPIAACGSLIAACEDALRGQEVDRRCAVVLLADLRRVCAEVKAARLHWEPIRNGRLAIGHRPGVKMIRGLPAHGTTDVLTLLDGRQGARQVEADVVAAGMRWHQLPLLDGKPPGPERYPSIRLVLAQIEAVLDEGGSLFVHCSAGIHRTGMISYALLRRSGLNRAEAMETMRALRPETAHGVGETRLSWVDSPAFRGADPAGRA